MSGADSAAGKLGCGQRHGSFDDRASRCGGVMQLFCLREPVIGAAPLPLAACPPAR
jgi:hypothetical protein